MAVQKIISGGQTGADRAGLYVAKRFDLVTGGQIPKGFKTLKGSEPWLGTEYGLVESTSDNYVPRTFWNVQNSNGTVRFAADFKSRGEICTKKAIDKYDKPYFDVDLTDPRKVDDFVAWLRAANIITLNVAGNAEETFPGCFKKTVDYLTEAFFVMGYPMVLRPEEVIKSLGLSTEGHEIVIGGKPWTEKITVQKKAS